MGCGASNQPNETMQIALESCRKAILAHIDNGYFSDELGEVLDIDSNSSDDAKCSALRATAELESEELVKLAPQLVCMLQDSDEGVRYNAVEAIGELASEELAKLEPQLVDMLQDNDPDVRQRALGTTIIIKEYRDLMTMS